MFTAKLMNGKIIVEQDSPLVILEFTFEDAEELHALLSSFKRPAAFNDKLRRCVDAKWHSLMPELLYEYQTAQEAGARWTEKPMLAEYMVTVERAVRAWCGASPA